MSWAARLGSIKSTPAPPAPAAAPAASDDPTKDPAAALAAGAGAGPASAGTAAAGAAGPAAEPAAPAATAAAAGAAAAAAAAPEIDEKDPDRKWRVDPWAAFVRGVRISFKTWDALQLSVAQEFVSRAAEKAAQLEADVLALFESRKLKVREDEVLDLLHDRLMGDLSTDADDGSPEQLSRMFVHLYKDCVEKGEFAGLNQIIEFARNKPGADFAYAADEDDEGDYIGEEGEEDWGDEDWEEEDGEGEEEEAGAADGEERKDGRRAKAAAAAGAETADAAT